MGLMSQASYLKNSFAVKKSNRMWRKINTNSPSKYFLFIESVVTCNLVGFGCH